MQECNLPQVSNCTEKRTIEFIKPYKFSYWCALRWLVRSIVANVDNMKWLGFGATYLSHATKLTSSKLANKPTNTQLFYIMC